jgi:GH35 family endo-1,4-beta-xylanase
LEVLKVITFTKIFEERDDWFQKSEFLLWLRDVTQNIEFSSDDYEPMQYESIARDMFYNICGRLQQLMDNGVDVDAIVIDEEIGLASKQFMPFVLKQFKEMETDFEERIDELDKRVDRLIESHESLERRTEMW